MTEIELKAHVPDCQAAVRALDAIATYNGSVQKDDEYWALASLSGLQRKKIRIRKQLSRDAAGCEHKETFLTYKIKETRTGADGIKIEVNDERECTVSDASVLESFFTDSGFEVDLKKHKDVKCWTMPLDGFDSIPAGLSATLELCNVPPLGNFMEIEILSPDSNPEAVEKRHGVLEVLLEKIGIPRSCIEPRYYSELLREMNAGA